MKKYFFICILFIGLSLNAQSFIENSIADWQRSKEHCLKIVKTMPSEKFTEKSSAEMRSFSEEIIHIIQANYGMMSTALGVENPNKSKLEFTSKEATIKELINCYDFVINNLKSFDEKKLDEIITVFGKYEYSRERVISKVYEHQAHHKSKSIVIQRYLGVTPPGYMLF
jgi:uncharacterized damage-inducible protein DinB